MSQWISVCNLDDLIPGTGVCALVCDQQVAIFRPDNIEQLLWIASPLKKQRFSLVDGHCLEQPDIKITCYQIQVHQGQVQVRL